MRGRWVGDIVAGFGSELKKSPLEMLEQQKAFLSGVSFYTDFGKIFFGDEAIEAKLQETKDKMELGPNSELQQIILQSVREATVFYRIFRRFQDRRRGGGRKSPKPAPLKPQTGNRVKELA
jgi:hypothetical protein